jgi:hypothetical protein
MQRGVPCCAVLCCALPAVWTAAGAAAACEQTCCLCATLVAMCTIRRVFCILLLYTIVGASVSAGSGVGPWPFAANAQAAVCAEHVCCARLLCIGFGNARVVPCTV